MKRILSLILVLLLSFSLCCVCASAEEAASSGNTVSAENAVSAEGAEDRAEGYDVFDLSLSRERIKDAFEKCHLDRKTLKILRKANWDKTDDMLRSELAACIRQHDQLQVEIDSLIPDELKEYFHGQNRTVPGNYKDIFDDFVQNRRKLYNEKVEAILGVQGEMVDLYLEMYNRGINTADQITNSINQLFESGATAAANALGIKLSTDGSYSPPTQPPQTPPSGDIIVYLPEYRDIYYHRVDNCGKMNPKNAEAVTIEYAKSQKFVYCPKCCQGHPEYY